MYGHFNRGMTRSFTSYPFFHLGGGEGEGRHGPSKVIMPEFIGAISGMVHGCYLKVDVQASLEVYGTMHSRQTRSQY